jgi:hypothetical protein
VGYQFSEQELACIRILADLFENEHRVVIRSAKHELQKKGMKLSDEEYVVLMEKMQHAGVIENPQTNNFEGRYCQFNISANAVQIVREIEHHEKEMQRELDLLKWQESRKIEDDKRNDERRADDRRFQAEQNELNRKAQAEQNELNRKAQADQAERSRRTQFWLTILAAFLAGVGTLGGFLIGMNKEPKEPPPIIINMPEPKK